MSHIPPYNHQSHYFASPGHSPKENDFPHLQDFEYEIGYKDPEKFPQYLQSLSQKPTDLENPS